MSSSLHKKISYQGIPPLVSGKFVRCNNFAANKIEAAANTCGGNRRQTVIL